MSTSDAGLLSGSPRVINFPSAPITEIRIVLRVGRLDTERQGSHRSFEHLQMRPVGGAKCQRGCGHTKHVERNDAAAEHSAVRTPQAGRAPLAEEMPAVQLPKWFTQAACSDSTVCNP